MPNIKDIKKEFDKRFTRRSLEPADKRVYMKRWFVQETTAEEIWSFIETALNSQKKEIEKKIEGRMDKKRARELCDRFEEYCGKRSCPFCGTNPEKQRKIILSLLRKEK